MEYKKEHLELIKNIIQKSPGYTGNEDLFEVMVSETLKKSRSFLESSIEISSLEIYLKKIVGNVIVEVAKNASTLREELEKQKNTDFINTPVLYDTDAKGLIVHKISLPAEKEVQRRGLSREKIELIKQKVLDLDKSSLSKNYKKIFELRFGREMSHVEIAKKLEMEEVDVSRALLELLTEIDSV